MTGRCVGWILKHGPRDRVLRAVLLAIADTATAAGFHARSRTTTIARKSLCTELSVRDAITQLIEGGWLAVEETGRGRKATVYSVLMGGRCSDER